ncbi:CCA tRNA nucleotidyltransferase [Candidatus Mcinerneyibacteriota bacterium]|nr:CCA tRNA nucleotidyltransferase [Candidatus Mcinerneyibacteriota bacterium]
MENRGFQNPLIPLVSSLAARKGLSLFAVGGAVRDKLLERGPFNDIDFVYEGEGFEEVVRDLQRHVRFKTIPFKNKGFSTLRLCFKSLILDFQPLSGATLDDDASHRDFTVNALYMNLEGGEWVLHDPLGGLSDMEKRLLRETAPDSFLRDPLRVLRLFRFSSSLGFGYGKETLALAGESASKLPSVSPERIKDELIKIFACFSPSLLRDMAEIGVFESLGAFRAVEFPRCGSKDYLLNLFLFFRENEKEGSLPDFLDRFRFSGRDREFVRALLSFVRISPDEVLPLFHRASAPLLALFSGYCAIKGEKEKGRLIEDIRRFASPLVDGYEAAEEFGVSGADLGRCLDRLHILQIKENIEKKEELFALYRKERKEY